MLTCAYLLGLPVDMQLEGARTAPPVAAFCRSHPDAKVRVVYYMIPRDRHGLKLKRRKK
ncbi:MAG: hypothetical protein AB7F41_06765 [Methylocystis sp.]|uniref:hypothetical protein n=1 Tax=Methylocystis sp. TaxID=1911079 RepID=UPI003D09E49B